MFKKIFFALFVKPIVLLIIGVHVKNRENLVKKGPCIIAANHNSHLDTMVLMSLFSLKNIETVQPVAAADYFLKTPLMKWISLKLIGIVPIYRKVTHSKGHPLQNVKNALNKGHTVIIFPEGSRGNPEELQKFKNGLAHLAKEFEEVPVIPVYLNNAGKTLPKGEALLVPLIIDIGIGKALYFKGHEIKSFTNVLEENIKSLQKDI